MYTHLDFLSGKELFSSPGLKGYYYV